jgi:DNA (cytosine-5)-methyltransferase 1
LLDDERNVHLLDFLRLVRELRPLVVLMENVPLIITSHDGVVIRELCDGLAALGYASCADILPASDYGVPQFRKRAFVLAYRSDVALPPQFPRRTHERVPMAVLSMGDSRPRFEPERLPYVSVEEAIGDLPSIPAGGGDEVMFYSGTAKSDYEHWAREGSVAIFNHRSRSHSKEFLEKIKIIVEGGRNQELPDDERFSDNYYSQAYARLHRHGIAQTVTTYFGNPGSGRFIHHRDLRSITVREAARFQSFKDSFVFDGLHSTQMRHVGNAVPPLLARALRDQIARDLLAAGVDRPRSVGRPRKPRVETPEERSRIMRAVPGKNTSAERALRIALSAAGLRGYRLHHQAVPGTPDVVFRLERLAVFVDGCFWHGCPECYREPKSHKEYWTMKVQRNKDRDAAVNVACKAKGWRVLRIWEHEVLRVPRRVAARVRRSLRRDGRTAQSPRGRPMRKRMAKR